MSLSAEALVATTGIWLKEPVSREHAQEAIRLPKEWGAEVEAFFDQEEWKKFKAAPALDWRRTWETLAKGVSPDEIAEATAELGGGDLAAEYQTVVSNAREYLRARWPVLKLEQVLGPPLLLEPGKVDLMRAQTLAATLNEPARVVAEMRSRSLSDEQVVAFKAVFPALYQMVWAMVEDQERRRRTANRSYIVPAPKAQVIRTYLQRPQGVDLGHLERPPERAARPEVKISFASQRTKAQALEERETDPQGG